MAMWSDLELAPDALLPHGPDRTSESDTSQAFFPLAEPVDVHAGDTVSVSVRIDSPTSGSFWNWTTTVRPASGERTTRFNQSTFMGSFRAPGIEQPGKVVTLSVDGHIDRLVLSLLEDGEAIDAIAREVREKFSDRFDSEDDARERVETLIRKYC
jgi:hypothetical protein